MSARRLAIVLVGALLLAACRGAAGETGQALRTLDQSRTASESPSASPIVQPPASTPSGSSGPVASHRAETPRASDTTEMTPQATHELSSLERSDLFWDALALGAEAQPQWYTLPEVVEVSDLVVRGRVTDIRPGRAVAGPEIQFVLTTVVIEEVLTGTPETREEGTIEIEWWLDKDAELADLSTLIPDHEALFFLVNQGLIAERAGHPEDVEQYRYQYTEINGAQGTLRDIEGTARSIYDDGNDWFPEEFDGHPYRDLVRSVRQAAGE